MMSPFSPNKKHRSRPLRQSPFIYITLIDSTASGRDKHRLRRLQAEPAGACVTAVPSALDGTDAISAFWCCRCLVSRPRLPLSSPALLPVLAPSILLATVRGGYPATFS